MASKKLLCYRVQVHNNATTQHRKENDPSQLDILEFTVAVVVISHRDIYSKYTTLSVLLLFNTIIYLIIFHLSLSGMFINFNECFIEIIR
jgi:hypothetical protein